MRISQALYLIDVLGNMCVAIVFILIILVGVLCCKAWWYSENEYSRSDEENMIHKNRLLKFAKNTLIWVIIGIFTISIIPSKETMRNILIVETVTDERTVEGAKEVYEWVKDEIKTWNEEE